jgi:hypothetical protein
MTKSSGSFKFRRGDSVGAIDAEQDRRFLSTCFVDQGDMRVLLDCSDPRCIVVGRTGSGKSALLLEVEARQPETTERISPEDLSLNYIANCDAVNVLTSLGINLDPFFRLLWRHVLALHVFQHIRPISEEEKKETLLEWASRFLRNDKTSQQKQARHQRVLEFLERYGGNQFWGDVGHRVQGIVAKFENELQSQLGREVGASAGFGASGAQAEAKIGQSKSSSSKKLVSSEVTIEERRRFQAVVNNMQLKELGGILDLVSEVLEDSGRDVYIVIDKLDTQWADESVRLRLVRALVDTVISFTAVSRLKIIVAMRIDLLERVYRDARHEPGTQFEKVKDHCLILRWDHSSLKAMINERIYKLVTDRYAPSYKVQLKDVVNPKIRKGSHKGSDTVDYILERTWSRPRDLIDFINECINRADGSPKISDDALLDAEGDYSSSRLRSLAEEWQLEYPYLTETLRILLGSRPRRFRLNEVKEESIHEWMDVVLKKPVREGDRIRSIAETYNASADLEATRAELASVLYKVGSVGIQVDESEKPRWATNMSYSLSVEEITQDSYIYVHLALTKALGIK